MMKGMNTDFQTFSFSIIYRQKILFVFEQGSKFFSYLQYCFCEILRFIINHRSLCLESYDCN